MQSQKSKFKYSDRGFNNPLVLVHGWATDYRIFDNLDLNFDYIFCLRLNPVNFVEDLKNFLDQSSIDEVSMLGFSMGAFLAAEFSSRYPQRVKELNLLGSRLQYEAQDLGKIKIGIKENKKAWLYRFYRNCFSANQEAAYISFKGSLLKEYIDADLNGLINGLDYLARQKLEAEKLKKVRFFHGTEDKIAPISEALEINLGLKAEFIRLQAGHFLFYHSDFEGKFNER